MYSVSYWLFNTSLVLFFTSFLGFQTKPVVVTSVQVQSYYQGCNFSTNKLYDISELLQCMNGLASLSMIKGKSNRVGKNNSSFKFFPSTNANNNNNNNRREFTLNSHYPESNYYSHKLPSDGNNKEDNYGSVQPALPPGYHLAQEFNFNPGIFGINLLDGLTSISQYDDRKCVLRIICEVATGTIPGNSQYKQYNNFNMNSLIRLLTTLQIGESSPLLSFGKSALMGYINRENPEICYQQYPKCPRNPSDLVDYLNNHNGGFFRFFNYRNSDNRYRQRINEQLGTAVHISDLISDHKATGELKFDNKPQLKRFQQNQATKVLFPDDQLRVNRFVKTFHYQSSATNDRKPSPTNFFPQDRKDEDVNDLLNNLKESKNSKKEIYNLNPTSNGRLYLSSNYPNERLKSFTFPDGKKITIDVGFSKLFSESYKKYLKDNGMDDEPIDLEGLNVINLAELYSQSEQIVVHPCDMICHDSTGTAVQFHQVISSSGSLKTLMTPDRPILDLSRPLPCEIICLDENGERRQLSTTLNQTLQRKTQQKELNQSGKIIQSRLDDKTLNKRQYDVQQPIYGNRPMMPLYGIPLVPIGNGPSMNPPGFGYSKPSGPIPMPMLAKQNPQFSAEHDSKSSSFGNYPNPYPTSNYPVNIHPNNYPSNNYPSNNYPNNNYLPPPPPMPSMLTLCGGYLYFLPVNHMTVPVCVIPLQTVYDNWYPLDGTAYSANSPKHFEENTTNTYSHSEKNQQMYSTNPNYENDEPETPNNLRKTPYIPAYGSFTEEISNSQPVYQSSTSFATTSTTTTTTKKTTTFATPPSTGNTAVSMDSNQSDSCSDVDSKEKSSCVPIKYHSDADYYDDSSDIKKRERPAPKIVIRTPNAKMYIDTV